MGERQSESKSERVKEREGEEREKRVKERERVRDEGKSSRHSTSVVEAEGNLK